MLPIATKHALQRNRELADHAHQLRAYCRSRGAQVEVIGAAPLDTQPRVYNPGQGSNIWTVTKLEDDPLIRQGVMAIPSAQLDNLKRIDAAGVEFTELLIAHELPADALNTGAGWSELDCYDLAVLEHNARVPDPLPTVTETRRVGDQIQHLAQRTIDGISQLTETGEAVGRSTLQAGVRASKGVAAQLAALDPVIIGVTTISGDWIEGELAAYYVLARWDW